MTGASSIKKVVLLGGGTGKQLSPLTKHCLPLMFPIFNEPILEHNIEFLVKSGLEEIIIVMSEEGEAAGLESICRKNQEKIKISFYRESKPRGSAGILADIRDRLDNHPFLVMNGSLFAKDINLQSLIDLHVSKQAAITVGVDRKNIVASYDNESISLSSDGMVKAIHIIHHSKEKRSPWMICGIYLFSPEVLEFIDREKYVDIKEQLIPQLKAKSLPVFACELGGYCRAINSLDDYWGVHRDLFKRDKENLSFKNKKEITEQVWVGRHTTISPGAYLMGPIVIGNDCDIAKGAQIIGPAVIGDGCKISEGSIVRESIIWNNVWLKEKSRSEFSIISEGLDVGRDEHLENLVAVASLQRSDVNLMSQHYTLTAIGRSNLFYSINNWVFILVKRLMDLVVSVFSLIFFFPLFIVLAVIVKYGSPGPVFYNQKRCGKDGRLFNMYKFRTMSQNASLQHNQLLARNESDGPMFKMTNDPRVTRIGRILRKTSLDELPQLFNVLTGVMSLVGPRPLIMDEMKYSVSWRDARLKVKPGMTGLWQVQGRSETSFHDWIKYDIDYVKNQSIVLDLIILWKTVSVIIKKVGAY